MLTDDKILAIVNSAIADAQSGAPQDLELALDYYLGKPNGTEIEGRSQVMSDDIADAIEWIMPQIMKAFTQNNEVVVFDPVHPGDELQAQIETAYIYELLMKQNNGFIKLHQLIKDALMQRNGILKVYYELTTSVETETYSGLTEEAMLLIVASQEYEVVSYTNEDEAGYTVTIHIERECPKICIDSVPPEAFLVNSMHNSIDLSTADFTAHLETKTLSYLKETGIDDATIDELGASSDNINLSAYRFDAQNESSFYSSVLNENKAMTPVNIAECYMFIDINEDGIAEYVKVTCAGNQPNYSHVLSHEELKESPWVSVTAILMSHKFQGLSIYDRIKSIQEQKTALMRNIFDNIYLTNNQRTAVVEGQVNLDDLLVSRPGGIVRVKRLDAITPIVAAQLGDQALGMVNYLDMVRGGKTGVSPEGSTTPTDIGDRVGSSGVDRIMTAKEELVGLMVRVIAETGIKPLCLKLRSLTMQHLDTVKDYKFRGQWVKINPLEWTERTSCTVRVGTGSGDSAVKITALTAVMQIQEKVMTMPGQALVNPLKIYQTIDELCKFSGLTGAASYFLDPNSEEGKQQAQQAMQASQQQQQMQQQVEQLNMEVQQKIAQAATDDVMAKIQSAQLKNQVDMLKLQLEQAKMQDAAKIKELEQQLAQVKMLQEADVKDVELELEYDKLTANTAIKLTEIEATTIQEQNENLAANIEVINNELRD